ncbi:MAG: hypothetical protein KAT28_00140 [Candidatus Aenigmarchaeota archaeon]|nr:hypothetical protein [Candidatus Aenigmarchaeota archaeon]
MGDERSITDNIEDYKVGQEAFYHESGEVYRVEILEVCGDEKLEKYKLKILEIVQESQIFKPSNVNEEFNCEKQRNSGGYSGLWYLLEY